MKFEIGDIIGEKGGNHIYEFITILDQRNKNSGEYYVELNLNGSNVKAWIESEHIDNNYEHTLAHKKVRRNRIIDELLKG